MLTREFFGHREAVLNAAACQGEYVWPESAPPFVATTPGKVNLLPPWADWLVNASVAAALGLLGFGVYWFLLR